MSHPAQRSPPMSGRPDQPVCRQRSASLTARLLPQCFRRWGPGNWTRRSSPIRTSRRAPAGGRHAVRRTPPWASRMPRSTSSFATADGSRARCAATVADVRRPLQRRRARAEVPHSWSTRVRRRRRNRLLDACWHVDDLDDLEPHLRAQHRGRACPLTFAVVPGSGRGIGAPGRGRARIAREPGRRQRALRRGQRRGGPPPDSTLRREEGMRRWRRPKRHRGGRDCRDVRAGRAAPGRCGSSSTIPAFPAGPTHRGDRRRGLPASSRRDSARGLLLRPTRTAAVLGGRPHREYSPAAMRWRVIHGVFTCPRPTRPPRPDPGPGRGPPATRSHGQRSVSGRRRHRS